MVWTQITRPDYCRKELRYASDLRVDEWEVVKHLLATPDRIHRPYEANLGVPLQQENATSEHTVFVKDSYGVVSPITFFGSVV